MFLSEGRQDLPLPDGMPAWVMTKRWFAKVYGFTPDQVDELPIEAITWWPAIEDAEAEASRRRQRQEMRQHSSRRG